MKFMLSLLVAGSLVFASCQNSDAGSQPTAPGDQAQAAIKDSTDITWVDSVGRNLGQVNKGQEVEITWRFRNSGDRPLVITNAQASCGCTVAEKPEEPIAPGAEGSIKAKFDSKSQSVGPYTKSVSVYSNARNAPVQTLTFNVEVTNE